MGRTRGRGRGGKEKKKRKQKEIERKKGKVKGRGGKGEGIGKGKEKGKEKWKEGKGRGRKGKRKETGREVKGKEQIRACWLTLHQHAILCENTLQRLWCSLLLFRSAFAAITPTSVDRQHARTDGHLKQMCVNATEHPCNVRFLHFLSSVTFCAKLSSHQVIFRKALL